MKINTNKLTKLLNSLQLVRSKLGKWRPSDERTALELESDDVEGEIVDLLKEAKVSKFELGKYTLALRNTPVYFRVTSEARLVSALRRHRLSKFLIPEYKVDLRGLKEYLLATKISLPGLTKMENQKSLYVFEKSQEIPSDLFVTHGVDEDLLYPAEHWKELWADLRYLANSAYPRLIKSKKWGDWTLQEIRKYFAKIIDALRSIHFPILEKKDTSSWWQLYWEAKGFMKSEPPNKEELPEWDKKRAAIIKMAEEYAGIYLVAPHALYLYQGNKTAILKSVKFTSRTDEPLFLISENFCYGTITLGEPEEVQSIEVFKAISKQHHVTDEERKTWWDNKFPLWLYKVTFLEKFEEPVEVRIPHGIQTFIRPENIEFT